MRLKSLDGPEVEFAILGYRFPGIKKDYWDSNWLNIRVRVRDTRGSWERTGPFLLAFEVGELATWLDAVAVEAPMINRETLKEIGRAAQAGFPNLRLYDAMEFMEPNLRFVLVERTLDYATIRVYFELEARPPWAPASGAGMEDLWVDFRVSTADVKAASQSLRSELSAFPVRAAH